MHFTILFAVAFATITVALQHENYYLHKRNNPPVICMNDTFCKSVCGPTSRCEGITIAGSSSNVCTVRLGHGATSTVTSICDVGPHPPRPPTPHPEHGKLFPDEKYPLKGAKPAAKPAGKAKPHRG